jgi:amidase
MKLDLLKVTAGELQRLLGDGKITSLDLVRQYHHQIFEYNDKLKAMISISPLPHVEKIASKLDEERRKGAVRGALHGIPFIIKVRLQQSLADIVN